MTLKAHLFFRLSARTNLFIRSNGKPRLSWNTSGRNPLLERNMAPPNVELRNGPMLNAYTACVSLGSRLVTFANPSAAGGAAGASLGLLAGAVGPLATGGVGPPGVPGPPGLEPPADGPAGGLLGGLGGSLPPVSSRMPPTIRPTTASSPSPPPTISTILLPPFFFFLAASGSSSRGEGLVLPLAPGLPFAPSGLVFTLSPDSSPASDGSSTTNRYLHLGQSTFLPTRLASLIGTIASQ